MSIITYQLMYYAWVRLETVEKKHGLREEIRGKEEEVRRLGQRREERGGDGEGRRDWRRGYESMGLQWYPSVKER